MAAENGALAYFKGCKLLFTIILVNQLVLAFKREEKHGGHLGTCLSVISVCVGGRKWESLDSYSYNLGPILEDYCGLLLCLSKFNTGEKKSDATKRQGKLPNFFHCLYRNIHDPHYASLLNLINEGLDLQVDHCEGNMSTLQMWLQVLYK